MITHFFSPKNKMLPIHNVCNQSFCKMCWKRALSLDAKCPCADKNGVCELSACVSAHPTQCRNTYAAMFQSFSSDELKQCERTSESFGTQQPHKWSSNWGLSLVILLLLLPIVILARDKEN